jgi:hypothetical protein
MLNPGPRLRGLIERATPVQAARAYKKARDHRALCVREGIEPAIAETFLIEQLEIIMADDARQETEDPETEVRRRLELYTGRDYSRSYTER